MPPRAALVGLVLLCCSVAPAVGGEDAAGLFGMLQRVPFRNAGLTLRATKYSWETVPVVSGSMCYLEKLNVSCTQCSWGGNTGEHRFVLPPPAPPPPPPSACAALNVSTGDDIPAHDLKTVQGGITTSDDCRHICCSTPSCDGFVFLPEAGSARNMACSDPTKPCCFLKTDSSMAPRSPSVSRNIICPHPHAPPPPRQQQQQQQQQQRQQQQQQQQQQQAIFR